MEVSETASISIEGLCKLGENLAPDSELLDTMSVVLTRTVLEKEVPGLREVGLNPGNMEERGGGEFMAGSDIRNGGELISSIKEVLVPDKSSGTLFIIVVKPECDTLGVTAESVPAQEDIFCELKEDVSGGTGPG